MKITIEGENGINVAVTITGDTGTMNRFITRALEAMMAVLKKEDEVNAQRQEAMAAFLHNVFTCSVKPEEPEASQVDDNCMYPFLESFDVMRDEKWHHLRGLARIDIGERKAFLREVRVDKPEAVTAENYRAQGRMEVAKKVQGFIEDYYSLDTSRFEERWGIPGTHNIGQDLNWWLTKDYVKEEKKA